MSKFIKGVYADIEYNDGKTTIVKLGKMKATNLINYKGLLDMVQKKAHMRKKRDMKIVTIYATDRRFNGKSIVTIINK